MLPKQSSVKPYFGCMWCSLQTAIVATHFLDSFRYNCVVFQWQKEVQYLRFRIPLFISGSWELTTRERGILACSSMNEFLNHKTVKCWFELWENACRCIVLRSECIQMLCPSEFSTRFINWIIPNQKATCPCAALKSMVSCSWSPLPQCVE